VVHLSAFTDAIAFVIERSSRCARCDATSQTPSDRTVCGQPNSFVTRELIRRLRARLQNAAQPVFGLFVVSAP
jgi:hypothetical protein